MNKNQTYNIILGTIATSLLCLFLYYFNMQNYSQNQLKRLAKDYYDLAQLIKDDYPETHIADIIETYNIIHKKIICDILHDPKIEFKGNLTINNLNNIKPAIKLCDTKTQ